MSDKLDAIAVLIEQIKRWEDKINEALYYAKNTHSFDDVVQLILTNRVLFFSYQEAFLIMERVEYPSFATFHCFLAGGKIEAVMEAQQQMEQLGKDLGCKYLSIAGRPGWQRVLASKGWKPVCVTLYREIEEVKNEQWKGRYADHDGQTARKH